MRTSFAAQSALLIVSLLAALPTLFFAVATWANCSGVGTSVLGGSATAADDFFIRGIRMVSPVLIFLPFWREEYSLRFHYVGTLLHLYSLCGTRENLRLHGYR